VPDGTPVRGSKKKRHGDPRRTGNKERQAVTPAGKAICPWTWRRQRAASNVDTACRGLIARNPLFTRQFVGQIGAVNHVGSHRFPSARRGRKWWTLPDIAMAQPAAVAVFCGHQLLVFHATFGQGRAASPGLRFDFLG